MELIENLIDNKDNVTKNELTQILKNIRKKFDEKKSIKEKLSNIKGKILIEKQIIEEIKRKTEENNEYYKEQLKEYEENRDNKDEYLKIFEKKLKEVEIYIHKNTKKGNSKFDYYKNFKMNDFIEQNTDLICRKEEIIKEITGIKSSITEVDIENRQYKNEFSFTNGKENETEKEDKTKNIYSYYKNQAKILEDRNKVLRQCSYKLNANLKHLNYYESKDNFY
jgi:chromosome segregation ATPase